MDVLIIDDDPTSVFLAKLLLSSTGLFDKLTTYQNPVDALSFIKVQLVDNQLPQVILLDINMPLIDGWQLLDALMPYQAQIQAKYWK
ncbi:response regulator [Dyadobacter arcticus]|uniref:CheY-like chemotaxis protein n=1 Tax=Dyadobacter arcticus TaxID=1078754 RepID=A0ABX0UU92_9BACT|nr:response regulator [Dyadobacter arcticus]NIJ55210.1 CheY-like chemotaxis protein [Dyadobacter arcticus]